MTYHRGYPSQPVETPPPTIPSQPVDKLPPTIAIVTSAVIVKSKTSNHQYFGNGSALGYYIDGVESPLLKLLPGKLYRFTQDDLSNTNHKLLFYADADRTTPHISNVNTVGIAGSPGAYTEILVTEAAPLTLYYQCVNHAYMGNAIQLNPSPGNNTGSTNYSYSLSKLSGLTSSNFLIGAFENFQFYNLGGNRQGIQKKGTTAIDEITGISTLTFNDTRISVSDSIIGVFNQVTGKETKDAQMFRLYNASFNRFPDSDGLKYWINEYSKGITDYRKIAESFIISNEFKQRYGATNTNLEFATNMYKNVLGRLPDSEGLNYWVSNLNAGTNSRVDVLGGFSESIENKNLFSQVTGFV